MRTISEDKYRRLKEEWDVVLPPVSFRTMDFRSAGQVADWGHLFLKAGTIYKTTRGSETVNFILDTGIDEEHEDLKANVLTQYAKDFTGDGLGDTHGHGTHCAGVVAAVDNSMGVIGVAPGAYLVQCKVLNNSGAGAYAWIADAIRYVADLELKPPYANKVKQISMSLGGPTPNKDLRNAIHYAIERGVIIYVAAGNSGYRKDTNTIGYPGRWEEVITIASIGRTVEPSRFSSAGNELDVTAPGEAVLSTIPNGYARMSGTSMATPHVCGIGALLVSLHPNVFKPGQPANQVILEGFIKEFAQDLYNEGFDIRTGAGAPIVTNYEGKAPKAPTPPEETEPVKPLRKIDLVKFPMYNFFYKAKEEDEYRTAKVRFEVSMKSKHTAEYVYQQVLEGLNWYMGSGNRHFNLLSNADLLDAGYWAGHFCKIILKNTYDLDIDLTHTTVYSDTATIELTGKALIRPPGTFKP